MEKEINFINHEEIYSLLENNSKTSKEEVAKVLTKAKNKEKEIIIEAYSQGRIDEETRFPYATDGEDYFKLEFTQSSE